MSDWVKNTESESIQGSIAAAVAAVAVEVNALAEYDYIPELDVHYDRASGYCFKEGRREFHHASSHYTYHFDDSTSSWQCSYDPDWDNTVGCSANLDAYLSLTDLLDQVELSETIPQNDPDDVDESDGEEINLESDDILPCIRAIVLEAEDLPYGHLSIITVDGAAVACVQGEDGVNAPQIVDKNIDEAICRISFDSTRRRFLLEKVLIESGEEEGELVDDPTSSVILNETVLGKDPVDISHQDRLVVDCGSEKGLVGLSLHIHKAFNTCGGCEPGLLLSNYPECYGVQSEPTNSETSSAVKSKGNLERERRRELKRLKKKYSLSRIDYVQKEKPWMPETYTDRADIRRRTVGSDLPESAVEAKDGHEAASVSKPVSEENKGFKMLEKMGWKKGAGVGRREDGIQEPVCPVGHMDASGLGSTSAMRMAVGHTNESQKRFRWSKAAQRYAKIEKNPIFDAMEDESK